MPTPQEQIPSFDDFLKSRGAEPANVWTLDRAGEIKDFYRQTFGRELPVSAFGESSTHRRMHLDHSEALDIPVQPNSAEGKAILSFLDSKGFPYLAYEHAVAGAATGPHIHVGYPSKGTGAVSSPQGIPTFDEFLQTQSTVPTRDRGPNTYTSRHIPIESSDVKARRRRSPFSGVTGGAQGGVDSVSDLARALGGAVGARGAEAAENTDPFARIGGQGNRVYIKPTQAEEQARGAQARQEQVRIEGTLTPADRQEIQEKAKAGANADWASRSFLNPLFTTVATGGEDAIGGILRTAEDMSNSEGFAKLFDNLNPHGPSDYFKKRAHIVRSAVEEADKISPMSGVQTALSAGGELLGNVALMSAAAELGGPDAAFSILPGAQARGRGASVGEAGFEAVKGQAYKNLFGAMENVPLPKRAAAMFAGTYGIEKTTGATDEQALKSAATNAGFVTLPEAAGRVARYARSIVKPGESTVPTREGADRTRLERRADAFESTVPERPQTWEQRVEGLDVPVRTIEGIRVVKHYSNFQPRAEDGTFAEGKPQYPESTVPQRSEVGKAYEAYEKDWLDYTPEEREEIGREVERQEQTKRASVSPRQVPETTPREVSRVPSESEAGAGEATRPTKIGSAFWEDVPGGRVATTTRRPSETFALEAEVEKSGALQRLYEQGVISSPDATGLMRAALKRFQGNPVAIENAYHQALLKLSSTDVESTARGTTFLPEPVGGTPVKGEEGAEVKQPHDEMTREEIKARGRQLANEKEPWEMSRDEFDVYSRADFYPDMDVHSGNEILAQYDKYGRVDGERRWVIERALEQGKTVPPEVLKDYPDLSVSVTPVKGEEGAGKEAFADLEFPSISVTPEQAASIRRLSDMTPAERARYQDDLDAWVMQSEGRRRALYDDPEAATYSPTTELTPDQYTVRDTPRALPSRASTTRAEAQVQERAKVEKPPTRYQQTGIRRKPSFDPETHDLTRFVISEGGIRVDRDRANAGEVNRLQKLRPGLINNKSGKSVEEMARAAGEAGFNVGEGGGVVAERTMHLNAGIGESDPDVFLNMLEEDARGLKKHHTNAAEIPRDELDQLNPDERAEFDNEMKFLADPHVSRSLKEVQDGKEDAGLREELYTLAANYGLTDDTVDAHLEYARENGTVSEGTSKAGLETGEGRTKLEDYYQPEQAGLGFREAESGLFAEGGAAPIEPEWMRGNKSKEAEAARAYAKRQAEYSKLESLLGKTEVVSLSSLAERPATNKLATRILNNAERVNAEGLHNVIPALEKYADLKDDNVSVSDYLKQESLFGEKELTPEQEKVLASIDRTGRLPESLIAPEKKTDSEDLFTSQVSGGSTKATSSGLGETPLGGGPSESTVPTRGQRFGPGAANVGDVPVESQIKQLTQAVQRVTNPKQSLADRFQVAQELADRASATRDSFTRGLMRVKATSSALYDGLTKLPEFTDFKRTLGEWLGANQKADFELMQFVKTANKQVPNPIRQEAITNYIQAGGDGAVLRERADASQGKLKRGYEAALNLTPEEKVLATNISSYLDSRLQEGIDAGLLDHGIDNYITQIWKKPNPVTQKLQADIQTGKLPTNFRYARQRLFDSYFEGEQAGYVPASKKFSDLIAAYDQSFNRALSARAFIKSLTQGEASDGRPNVTVSGSGSTLPDASAPEAVLIRPRSKVPIRPSKAEQEINPDVESVDVSDYRTIDHPALRKWKWVQSADGTPVMLQGDLLVHPEVYEHLNNVLKASALRKNPVGKFILGAQSTIKQTMLSVSGFHQVQEAVHAIGHRINPAGARSLDFDNPAQMELVNHGLQVADYNAQSLFSEGLASGNLTNAIPILGKRILKPYTEYLFHDYIPRLKMETALHIVDRNMERYKSELEAGTVSRDQIVELSARQANAAYGELNYKYMGRNPTTQDVLRLFLLAPDFLEARGRFVGQALKPHGREQLVALGTLAVTQFIGARILNKIFDDDWHWDRPFSLVYKGHEYTLRSVPEDIYRLISDPRAFIYNRLSPVVRTATEAMTGRDERGIKRDLEEQVKDLLTLPMPISLRRKGDDAWWEPVLNSFGVQEKKYRTQAEEMMGQILGDKMGQPPTGDELERLTTKRNFIKSLREDNKDFTDIQPEVDKALKSGTLKLSDIPDILKGQLHTQFEDRFKQLGIEDAVKVSEVMTPDERKQTEDELMRKRPLLLQLPEEKRKALEARIDALTKP